MINIKDGEKGEGIQRLGSLMKFHAISPLPPDKKKQYEHEP